MNSSLSWAHEVLLPSSYFLLFCLNPVIYYPMAVRLSVLGADNDWITFPVSFFFFFVDMLHRFGFLTHQYRFLYRTDWEFAGPPDHMARII